MVRGDFQPAPVQVCAVASCCKAGLRSGPSAAWAQPGPPDANSSEIAGAGDLRTVQSLWTKASFEESRETEEGKVLRRVRGADLTPSCQECKTCFKPPSPTSLPAVWGGAKEDKVTC